jgi:uncharacterized protein (TIGR03435 family)
MPGFFDCEIRYDAEQPYSIIAAANEQLGLELKQDKRPVEMLVVQHTTKPSDSETLPAD